MKKLTDEQETTLHQITEKTKEEFLIINKAVLFDIKKVTTKGEEIRAELNNLSLANELVKMQVKQQFDADVKKVKEFLGEYADAVIVSHDERCGNYYYSIGVNDDNKVFATYPYGKEDFVDYHNYVEIDGRKYQKYIQYEIDTYADGYGNEHHQTLEDMFNDVDVVQMFEIALQDYVVYHKKESEAILTE
jgi:hypothetical protein